MPLPTCFSRCETLYDITHSPLTHIRPSRGRRLHNNWHSEHEYTAGICSWFPCVAARARQGDVSPACASRSTPFRVHYRVSTVRTHSSCLHNMPHSDSVNDWLVGFLSKTRTLTRVISAKMLCVPELQQLTPEDWTCQVPQKSMAGMCDG